jgi:large subunit ribosomal protein L35
MLYLYTLGYLFFSGLMQMPKMKTHKGIKKRFKLTAKGKLRYKHPGAGHLLSSKNAKRLRRLRAPAVITGVYAEKIKLALGR